MVIYFNSKTQEYAWLSNFCPCPIKDNQGRVHKSAEHLYQYAKCARKSDQEKISAAGKAATARSLGQSVEVRSDWFEVNVEVMRKILRAKFTQNEWLGKRLVETGEATLIHDSPWDGFWGTGRDGKGKNFLGFLLMELRKELR